MEDKNKIMYIKKIYMYSHLVVDLPIFYYDCVLSIMVIDLKSVFIFLSLSKLIQNHRSIWF